jgi:hypothetical protein
MKQKREEQQMLVEKIRKHTRHSWTHKRSRFSFNPISGIIFLVQRKMDRFSALFKLLEN